LDNGRSGALPDPVDLDHRVDVLENPIRFSLGAAMMICNAELL